MIDEEFIRHSHAESVVVETDPEAKARLEAANALLQAERVREIIVTAIDGRPFKLRPSTLLDLNRCAIDGLDAYAGNWRPGAVEIKKSKHVPPGAHQVPEFIEEMCDYVNENWSEMTATHLSAFVMWRLNWIHPFTDGNGRTARAASYVVLCIRSGVLLPGTRTIPEQIVENRIPYYEAIEDADEIYKRNGFSDGIVAEMESLLSGMLANQLADLHKNATSDPQS